MSKTNCINCGAGKDVNDLVCPFCGTKYADLATFDLMSTEPIYIQLNGRNGHPVTAKAYVTRRSLNYMDTIAEAYRDVSGRLVRRKPLMHINGSIEFTLYEGIDDD